MNDINIEKILKLVEIISNGTIDKSTLGNVTAYRVKNIIRIDIKLDEK